MKGGVDVDGRRAELQSGGREFFMHSEKLSAEGKMQICLRGGKLEEVKMMCRSIGKNES